MKYFSCKNLSFYYGKKLIFKDIKFDINEKDIIALVGNNGVGKTTLLKIIIELYKNNNIKSNLEISFLINKPSFYPYMTGYQNLYYYKMIYNSSDEKIKEVLNLVKLDYAKSVKYSQYSLGMKQRLAIAKCLLKDADLYIFDEPFNGLDPDGIILFRKVIQLLKNKNKMIIISSHIFKELESYCNKIFFLSKQNLQVIDNTNNNDYFLITFNKNQKLKFAGSIESLNIFLRKLLLRNLLIKEIHYKHLIIEDLFIKDKAYENI